MRLLFLILILTANDAFAQLGDITAKSLGAAGGSANDTTIIQRGITNASARGVAFDLQGGTYLVTGLAIDRTVTIKNGTLKAYAAQTNTYGLVRITNAPANVILENVVIDGNSTATRVMRIFPGATDVRLRNVTIKNASQPSGLNIQACALMINGETTGIANNLVLSNVVSVANGVIGSDDMGVSRGLVMITSSSEGPPNWTFNGTSVGKIYSTGSSDREDADGIAVHRFGDILAHIVFNDTVGYDTRKRLFKIMTDGVTINGFEMVYSDTCTNMLEIVGGYAGNLTVRGGKIPAMGQSYGIGIVNNQSAMGNVVIEGNQIFNGTNTVMSATAEGIRVGGSYGTTNVVVANNTIGTYWGKPLLGIHIAGGLTNYTVLGNTIWAGEAGVYDGWRYSGEQTWGYNRFGVYTANVIDGNPSDSGFRIKKTTDLTFGANSINAVIPYTIDDGYAAVMRANTQWVQNIIGGSATNLNAVHIGDSASTTYAGQVPELQVASATGTNAMILVRFYDGTNNRMIAISANTNGIAFDSSYSSGGNGTFMFRVAGTEIATWDSSGGLHLGDASAPKISSGSGAPSAGDPNGSTYHRTDGTGPNLYVRENGAWVAK